LFFVALTCLGFTNPNATALALSPFTRNVGSASALLGFLQIGVAGLASAGIGFLNVTDSIPVAAIMAVTASIAFVILSVGRKHIGKPISPSAKSTAAAIH
jgi:DHA1 family bicyclomycin/chloramphenicol resistance-like MFS transporter